MEKLLPQNVEAECATLGSIIIDPDAISRVADFLQPRDFYRDAHRRMYEAIVDLTAQGSPADFITLCDELERRKELDDIGGAGYITSLINLVPTSGNIEYYGHIVERTSTLRQLIHGAGQIAAIAYEEEPTALEQAEEIIFKIGQRLKVSDFETSEEIGADVINDLNQLQQHKGEIIGVPTGFWALDRCLGGLQKSDLIIAAGRPGMGKTSFALNLAHNAMLRRRSHVAVFSCEMSKKQLYLRLLSMYTGIDSQRLRNGQLEDGEWDVIVPASDKLSEMPLWIDDTGGISLTSLRSKARRLHIDQGLDLIIVDYLQLMQATMNGKRIEPRLREVEEISKGLKEMAKELNVPVLALAQLSRAVEQRTSKVPQLSDLRESGSIENDADIVLFLYRDDYYAGVDEDGDSKSDRPETADVIVAKHRSGPTGEISLDFDAPHTRFFNTREERMTAYAK